MPTPTLIATPGAANANSYATVAEADTYHDAHLYGSTWTALTSDQKTVALIMATRMLDSLYTWAGLAANEDQALLWPRSGVMDHLNISLIESTVVPQKLKEATAEQARLLAVSDLTATNSVQAQGINRIKAGPVELGFESGVAVSYGAQVVPNSVQALLPPWWGYVRGTRKWVPAERC